MDRGPWTTPWTWCMDHPMDLVHGPSHGPGAWTIPWTWSMDHPMDLVHGPPHGSGPWTAPNFQKEIAPVNMKIYQRSGYEKHRLLFIAYISELCYQATYPIQGYASFNTKLNTFSALPVK